MENSPPTPKPDGTKAAPKKQDRVPTLKEIERRMLISQTNKVKILERKFDPNMEEIKIPKRINRPVVSNDKDLYDMTGYKRDPRRRKSWPEFCRDFIGQSQGAIAQDLLELHNSLNASDRIQFLKFMMEMGKAGYPAGAQLDPSETRQITNDMYAQLEAMSTTGIAPSIGKEKEFAEKHNEQKDPDPSAIPDNIPEESPEAIPEGTPEYSPEDLPQDTPQPESAPTPEPIPVYPTESVPTQDLMAEYQQGWKASRTVDDTYAPEEITDYHPE